MLTFVQADFVDRDNGWMLKAGRRFRLRPEPLDVVLASKRSF